MPTTTPHHLTGCHWPMLGTVIEISISAHHQAEAERAEYIICDEIQRLELTFSIFEEVSMLRRWIADPTTATSCEFTTLLGAALAWQQRSGGAFNVDSGQLRKRWATASVARTPPSAGELDVLCNAITEPPYRFDNGGLHQNRFCTGVDLNAIAKGFIVDSAIETARHWCDTITITVNAGGDIAHHGPTPIQVGVADPLTRLDNAPPLFTVDVHNAAIATSGSARRGVDVDGTWVSHIIDPRTGQPADTSASVTVLAANAATADVVATIVTVMEPDAGLAFVQSLNASRTTPDTPIIECWIVDREREIRSHRSA